MQENNPQIAKNIINRLKKSLKVETDTRLSEILNIKPNTISSWKKRNTLDYSKIIDKCVELNIDLNLIFSENLTNFEQETFTPIVSKDLIYQYTSGKLMDSLEVLPTMKFPYLKNKESIAFQIDKSLIDARFNKDCFAICEKTSLNNIIDNDIVIVISNKLGFFVTKIKPSLGDTEKFIISIDNGLPFNKKISIATKDIDELWKVTGILSFV
ncbi:helix-turn-helix domain-containing protein [Flavobacterium terrigena]|uniref:Bacteriophage CI repressor helix-turn-helix domain-containing protein n=1 Tax=Flavobacterium terrigena TaxID=402734 RepID=A0A1H6QS69_9FLAO|nr:helix-turn-helix domain-containing protein [Flavobacterium terrigena]SEI43027.1 Bacteriophage CI repressor helix-turn-helix domain-containing protein [Flavobacterium terrigena]